MRPVVMFNRISIGGSFATANEKTFGMDWFVPDPEIDSYVRTLGGAGRRPADTLLLGRLTFEGFERSWVPFLVNPETPPGLKAVAEELTNMKKVVFSRTVRHSEWRNTEFFPGDPAGVVARLKKDEGGVVMVMGSGSIVQQLTEAGLIDEYVFILSPVLAAGGKPLFRGESFTGLHLEEVKAFESGNVVLRYTLSQANSNRE